PVAGETPATAAAGMAGCAAARIRLAACRVRLGAGEGFKRFMPPALVQQAPTAMKSAATAAYRRGNPGHDGRVHGRLRGRLKQAGSVARARGCSKVSSVFSPSACPASANGYEI